MVCLKKKRKICQSNFSAPIIFNVNPLGRALLIQSNSTGIEQTSPRHIHVHYHIFHKIQIFQTLRPCESLAIQAGMVRDGEGTAEKKYNNGRTATFSSARTLSSLRKDNILEHPRNRGNLSLRNECEAESFRFRDEILRQM